MKKYSVSLDYISNCGDKKYLPTQFFNVFISDDSDSKMAEAFEKVAKKEGRKGFFAEHGGSDTVQRGRFTTPSKNGGHDLHEYVRMELFEGWN